MLTKTAFSHNLTEHYYYYVKSSSMPLELGCKSNVLFPDVWAYE